MADDNPGTPQVEIESEIAQCQNSAYGIVFHIVKNHDDTMDILQTAFLSALKYWSTFEERARRTTWFTAIARNKAIDFVKLRARQAEREISFDECAPIASDCTVEEAKIDVDKIFAVANLTATEVRCVDLRRRGFTHAQIAKTLGLPSEHAAGEHFRRARKKVAAALEGV